MNDCEICGKSVIIDELVDVLSMGPLPAKLCGNAKDGVFRFYHEKCALNELLEAKNLRAQNEELKKSITPEGFVLCPKEEYWCVLPQEGICGITWQDDSEMSWGCLDNIKSALESLGTNMEATPPMFYNDAIYATVARRVSEALKKQSMGPDPMEA